MNKEQCVEVIAPYSCQQLYSLVNDIESYAQFIPWCSQSVIDEHYEDGSILATLVAKDKGIHIAFTTLNHYMPYKEVTMSLVKGPFEQMEGKWKFIELGDTGCKVSFFLHYHFSNYLYEKLFNPLFERITSTIVDSFLERAKQIYATDNK